MKVTIFGATGFSGKAILAESLKQGHEVTILVRDPSKIRHKHHNLTAIQGDVMDPNAVASVLHHQEVVIQCLGVGGKGLKLSITLGDVATFMVNQITDNTYSKQAPSISN
ncbi:MAG: NAD(P)H-binding protein [Bacteroidetes bacterium]|nr:NAD(P)H-binding protein [Bacteroidota bacterium]